MSNCKYSPNIFSKTLLGEILGLLNRAERIEHIFATEPKAILKLAGGELYFD